MQYLEFYALYPEKSVADLFRCLLNVYTALRGLSSMSVVVNPIVREPPDVVSIFCRTSDLNWRSKIVTAKTIVIIMPK